MNKDVCRIKGSRQGLVVEVGDGATLGDVLSYLEAKISVAQSFFAGADVRLAFSGQEFSKQEISEIAELMSKYDMSLDLNPISNVEATNKETEQVPGEETLLVRRTLRSGQKIHYDGNVVVMGDVNPGAEVACTGDIVVLGSLRGVAHAGIGDRVDATVFAFRLEPTQLRIAHYISRSPDEKLPQPQGPEVAKVVDNIIQISAYDHWGT